MEPLRNKVSDRFFRSFRAPRFLLLIPRVPPSLHPGLSSLTPSAYPRRECCGEFIDDWVNAILRNSPLKLANSVRPSRLCVRFLIRKLCVLARDSQAPSREIL